MGAATEATVLHLEAEELTRSLRASLPPTVPTNGETGQGCTGRKATTPD